MDSMTAEYKPILGQLQTGLGFGRGLKFPIVKKSIDRLTERAIDQMLDTVAENVIRRIGKRDLARVARESGVSRGSVQRIVGGSAGYAGQAKSAAQIDTLLRLARYFGVHITALFIPYDLPTIVREPPPEQVQTTELERRRGRQHPGRP